MINTAHSSPGPNSRFLGRSTMEHVHGILLEHVYGILLDEKFLYRSVHAAFVNTKWYEAWLERTLLLDPIIFDMWIPGVLSWAPGQPCNSHHSRHIRLASLCAFVLFVQSRRRPEKWTRTRKWDSRGSVRVDFVCVCTFFRLQSFAAGPALSLLMF